MSNYKLSGTINIQSSSTTGQANVCATGSSNAVNVKAPASLASDIDFTLPATAGTTNYLLRRTGAASTGWNIGGVGTSGNGLPLLMNTQIGNPLPSIGRSITIAGQSYAFFIFSGTTAGSPTLMSVVATATSGSSATMQIRDFTNANNLIASVSFAGPITTPTIFSTTTFTNLPAGQSIFQVIASAFSGTSVQIFCIMLS
jgi:hypothetical protein